MEPTFQVLLFTAGEPQVNDYKRRRSHNKSRSGCLRCKRKRVKCDERRPACTRCARNSVVCSREGTASGSSSPAGSGADSWALQLSDLHDALPFEEALDCGISTRSLLRNFEQQWVEMFGVSWSSLPISIFHAYAHVRHAVLALSACHLRHHLPDATTARRTEHYHQVLALRDYQHSLNMPFEELGQDGTDALLVTAMLFNTLSFVLPSHEDDGDSKTPDVSRSWVFSPRDDRLGWLAIEMGLKPLLKATRQYRERSALSPIFVAADNEENTLTRNGLGLENVPKTWLRIFGLPDVDSQTLTRQMPDPQADIFREPLRLIAEVRSLKPTLLNMLHYVQFIGKLDKEFRNLLFDRDSRALWLFGYWLGLMSRFENLWWLKRRSRRDFKAVCQWLTDCGLADQPGWKGALWAEVIRDLEQANWIPR